METQQTDMTDPRREVGGIEAFFRGLGQSYANAGRTLAAAGSAPFVLADKAASAITGHPITGAEDLAFDILKPAFEAPKYYQIDPQKEVIKSRAARVGNVAGNAVGTVQQMAAMPGGAGFTGFRAALAEGAPALAKLAAGAVPGTITRAAPAIVPPAIDAGQRVLDAGGSPATAMKVMGTTAATNAALSFLPLSMPGSWITRGLTGGAVGAAGTVPQTALNNWALGDDPNVQGLKQPLLDPEAMGQNALVQGLMGVIGGRTPDVAVNGLIKPFMEKARELLAREHDEAATNAVHALSELIPGKTNSGQADSLLQSQAIPNINSAETPGKSNQSANESNVESENAQSTGSEKSDNQETRKDEEFKTDNSGYPGYESVRVPKDTLSWFGFPNLRLVANYGDLADRHAEYYDSPDQVRDHVDFVLDKPDDWYQHKDGRITVFREGNGMIPSMRLDLRRPMPGLSSYRISSVYPMELRQVLRRMRDKKKYTAGMQPKISVRDFLKGEGKEEE